MKIKIFVSALLAGSMFLSLPLWAQKTDSHTIRYNSDDSYINTKEDGHVYKIRLKGNTVTEMEVDGKIIPASEYSKYDAFIKKLLKQLEEDRRQAELDRKQAEKDREQADKDRVQAELDRRQADKDRIQAEADRTEAEKDIAQAEKDRTQAALDRRQADKDRIQAEKDRLQAEGDRNQAEKDRAQAELDRKQAEKDRAQADIDRKNAEADRKLYEEMIAELISDKLLESRSALTSIVLDNKEFSINGVKQPGAMQEKYAAKYLKGKNSSMRMNHSQ
ncbi:MAG: hypothetical protein EOO03_08960 [Chitinophagaceae bacterium]|nr:MAG: hypothetical protein EOO03_08960 [Chitinophagaceae bacterium]